MSFVDVLADSCILRRRASRNEPEEIQLDQAPAHCSDRLNIPDNIVLLYQPAHSPELNPIERLWQDLKLDFKGENFATLDELRTALRETLSYVTPEWIASMTRYRCIMRALSISITS
jgi:transposase